MRRILHKIKYMFRILYYIIYLIIKRIKNRKATRGVAQIVDSYNFGGLEQVATNVYQIFYQKKYNSSVICVSNNVGKICEQLNSPKDLRIINYDLADMLKYCAKNNIRTLIFHYSTFHFVLLRLLGFKTYYIIHNTYIWFSKKQWIKLKHQLKTCTGIIAVSEWCKDYFMKKTGISKIKVILNGIDFEKISNGQPTSITRESLKIKEDEITCLTLGSYTEGKHQMAIIGIMEKLYRKNPKIKYICAGPILNPYLYNIFIKKVNKSPARRNIILLKNIPQNEVGSFIREVCDIYIQPSIHEAGVPLTVMEALINGKPVIMTDFMLSKTFPNCSRIIGVTPPYKDIMDITPKEALNISKKTVTKSTKEYVKKINESIKNLDYLQEPKNFNKEDYSFLSKERMAKDYIDFIKI